MNWVSGDERSHKRPSWRRAALLLVLLGMHIALAYLLLLAPRRPAPEAARQSLPVQLLPLRIAKPRPPQPKPLLTGAHPGSRLPHTSLAPTSPITSESESPSAPADSPAPGLSAPAAPALRLGLPMLGASGPVSGLSTRVNPALSDPRSNTRRLTLEQRIARAINGVCQLEERMPDGSTRSVAGRMVEVPKASSTSDPFGRSFSTGGGQGTGGKAPVVAVCIKAD